jgi:hypothetical protein
MVTRLDDTGGSVEIENVLIGGRIAKEDARIVVSIKFGPSWTSSFNTHVGPECFEVCDVGFAAMPTFKWSLVSHGVDESVVEIDDVEEGGRPESSRKAGTVQEGANVVYLRATILRGAIRAGGFDYVPKILEHGVAEGGTPGKFAVLVRPDDAGASAIFWHEGTQDSHRGFLGFGEETPDVTWGAVDYEEVSAMAIVWEDNPIRLLIRSLVVFSRWPDEAKIHE